eukprot:11627643-Alexandrium_andersonii.AAC.1
MFKPWGLTSAEVPRQRTTTQHSHFTMCTLALLHFACVPCCARTCAWHMCSNRSSPCTCALRTTLKRILPSDQHSWLWLTPTQAYHFVRSLARLLHQSDSDSELCPPSFQAEEPSMISNTANMTVPWMVLPAMRICKVSGISSKVEAPGYG